LSDNLHLLILPIVFSLTEKTNNMKVIGAGFSRTGTMSFKYALEQLGYQKCYHMHSVFMNPDHLEYWYKAFEQEKFDWELVFEDCQATSDFPACLFWKQLLDEYPDAKVILTIRDAEKWYASMKNTIYEAIYSNQDNLDPILSFVKDKVFEELFEGQFENKDKTIQKFDALNNEIIKTLPNEKLLVYNVKEGWQPICQFLNHAIPESDFPNKNSTKQFRKHNKM